MCKWTKCWKRDNGKEKVSRERAREREMFHKEKRGRKVERNSLTIKCVIFANRVWENKETDQKRRKEEEERM